MSQADKFLRCEAGELLLPEKNKEEEKKTYPFFADYYNPVFDGPQPRDKKKGDPLADLNTENAGE